MIKSKTSINNSPLLIEDIEEISISIILPIYNVAKYLSECLDTIINQSFNKIEIIAIDDNSTDNSYKILKEYATKDSRIIVLKNPYNIGAARTRNIGIQLARGKYLAILDADDFFELDFLTEMFTEAEKTKSDLTICSYYQYIDNIQKDSLCDFFPAFMNKKLHNPFNSDDIYNVSLKIFSGFAVVPFNKLILRSWLLENDIYFQDLPNSNDVYFGSVVIIYANRISYIDKPLIHKRVAWGGNIESHKHENPYSAYYALKKMYHILKITNKFNIYYKSFNAYVIDSIMYIYTLLQDKEQDVFLEFWKKIGFSSLGMLNLNEDNFLTIKYYYQWRLILEKSSIKYDDFIIVENNRTVLQKIYEEFFNELSKKNFKTAVWGYGIEGNAFIQMGKIYNYNLIEVYDKDKNKHQNIPIPVKFFENRNKDVNVIIVTNTHFAKDIVKCVKNQDKNIKVFDFGAFLEYGISFADSELL